MKRARFAVKVLLGTVCLTCAFPVLLTHDLSDEQFRSEIDLPPSFRYPLGTDDLGRNRLARLLNGTRTSLLLAPAAAFVSVAAASLIALATAGGSGRSDRLFEAAADLTGSLPWLFVLIAARAAIPLDSPPTVTTGATFLLLAVLGWAGPARVLRNMTVAFRDSDFALQAQALGTGRWRFRIVHLLPNILPVAAAQFWISIPAFVLAEANLGLLGMGVSEPFPSLGNQLRDLESYTAVVEKPWLLAPAILLTIIVSSLWIVSQSERTQ